MPKRITRTLRYSTRRAGETAGPGPCPCGMDNYPQCCGRYLDAELRAPTAEALMRSRYTAYALRREDYLLVTWAPETRPALELDPGIRWTGLTVGATSGGGLFDTTGTVRFAAAYTRAGRPDVLQENSLFRREAGAWVYVAPA